MDKGILFISATILLSLGITGSGFFIGNGYYQTHMNNRSVIVKGLAEMPVKADLAIWNIKFQTIGNDLTETQSKINNHKDLIIAFLNKNGFRSSEITIGRINTNDLDANPYREKTAGQPRFILTQNIYVRSNQVNSVAHTSEKIGELVGQGIVFANTEYEQPISYLFTGLNQIKPVMLEEATQNARQAATEFAKNSQAVVGKIRKANQGVFSILPQDAAPGVSETAQIDKTVRVVSTVEYFLE